MQLTEGPGCERVTDGHASNPVNCDASSLARVVVIGSSCSGKTTFARRLADVLGSTHIELDALHWGPDWVPKPPSEFAALVDLATAGSDWVVDGNYSVVRQVVWPRATAIVWLNPGFATVCGRALRRTVRRSLAREELYAGNRESLRRAFLSRDSILLWVVQTYHRRRREFSQLRQTSSSVHWFELRRQQDVAAFLEKPGRAAVPAST